MVMIMEKYDDFGELVFKTNPQCNKCNKNLFVSEICMCVWNMTSTMNLIATEWANREGIEFTKVNI